MNIKHKITYTIDITKPPVGPPPRLANCFWLLTKTNKERTESYNQYVREYRRELELSRSLREYN